jgi:hypothetical protein
VPDGADDGCEERPDPNGERTTRERVTRGWLATADGVGGADRGQDEEEEEEEDGEKKGRRRGIYTPTSFVPGA